MTFNQLIRHFKTQTQAAVFLGVTKGAVNQWRLNGIPELRQYQIEYKTDGKLKAVRHEAKRAKTG